MHTSPSQRPLHPTASSPADAPTPFSLLRSPGGSPAQHRVLPARASCSSKAQGGDSPSVGPRSRPVPRRSLPPCLQFRIPRGPSPAVPARRALRGWLGGHWRTPPSGCSRPSSSAPRPATPRGTCRLARPEERGGEQEGEMPAPPARHRPQFQPKAQSATPPAQGRCGRLPALGSFLHRPPDPSRALLPALAAPERPRTRARAPRTRPPAPYGAAYSLGLSSCSAESHRPRPQSPPLLGGESDPDVPLGPLRSPRGRPPPERFVRETLQGRFAPDRAHRLRPALPRAQSHRSERNALKREYDVAVVPSGSPGGCTLPRPSPNLRAFTF